LPASSREASCGTSGRRRLHHGGQRGLLPRLEPLIERHSLAKQRSQRPEATESAGLPYRARDFSASANCAGNVLNSWWHTTQLRHILRPGEVHVELLTNTDGESSASPSERTVWRESAITRRCSLFKRLLPSSVIRARCRHEMNPILFAEVPARGFKKRTVFIIRNFSRTPFWGRL
jgi:hypothetical protein